MVNLKEREQMFFLRLIHSNYFYEYETISLWDFTRNVLLLVGIILFFYLIKYLTSKKSTFDTLNSQDDNRIVSPFLIKEQNAGLLYYSSKKKSKYLQTIAILLILIFILIPFMDIIDQNNFNFLGFIF